ncbi:hypothetical protein EH165_00055 [Nakamurella antarctica]|uniref:Uncharacterized protein n=1 Tax=Nakamurella antarctica TaxID=1902245 RepID=A0A3G8ZSN0_9ACTN|nr:hypothetical protein EH165_00055 [Nakamurella antarctica]
MTQRGWDDAKLINASVYVHQDDREFGYRLITDELLDLGYRASENRDGRLRSQQRIFSAFAKKTGLRSVMTMNSRATLQNSHRLTTIWSMALNTGNGERGPMTV